MHTKRSMMSIGLFLLILAVNGLIVPPQPVEGSEAGQSLQKRVDLDDPPYRSYPKKMSGMGTVDRIGADEIVIDDSAHRLSPAVVFHTPTNRFAPISGVSVGQYVGYIENRGEILSIWLLIPKN